MSNISLDDDPRWKKLLKNYMESDRRTKDHDELTKYHDTFRQLCVKICEDLKIEIVIAAITAAPAYVCFHRLLYYKMSTGCLVISIHKTTQFLYEKTCDHSCTSKSTKNYRFYGSYAQFLFENGQVVPHVRGIEVGEKHYFCKVFVQFLSENRTVVARFCALKSTKIMDLLLPVVLTFFVQLVHILKSTSGRSCIAKTVKIRYVIALLLSVF